jgi:hypothetical protein
MRRLFLAAALTAAAAATAGAQTLIAPGVLRYGDADCLGFNCYGNNNPTAGAALQGLAAGATSLATNSFQHGFPFTPAQGDFAGTDRIYVGSNQTGFFDGYSQFAGRTAGPQTLTLNYGSLVGSGEAVTSLTLGIMADDFQSPTFGNPFTARINGVAVAGLTALLNQLNQTGPLTRFVSFGVDASLLSSSNVLTLTIDQGGNGGDGWAVDFLTVGVGTASTVIPEPATVALVGAGLVAVGAAARRRRSA